MEINKLEDLIPYQRSLKELYQQEEFQVLLCFLSSIKAQKEAELFAIQATIVKAASLEVHLKVQECVIQRNMAAMLAELPTVVREVEAVLDKQKRHAEAFEKAQRS